jgi:hypothetical protein
MIFPLKGNVSFHSKEQSDEESRFFAVARAFKQRFFASLRMTCNASCSGNTPESAGPGSAWEGITAEMPSASANGGRFA